MDIGIPVEVEGIYGEFYSGIICGLNSLEEFRVSLLDNSRNGGVVEITLPPSSMRLPPELSSFPFEPLQGQEVDVLIPCAPAPENEGDGDTSAFPILSKLSAWWPGRVKKVGGGFVIVELVSAFSAEEKPDRPSNDEVSVSKGRVFVPLPTSIEKTDIVEKQQLRPRSQQTNFSSNTLRMHAIDIPDQLVSYCKEPANYLHFARRCGLPVLVCMAPESMRPSEPVKAEGSDTYEQRARLLVISTELSTVNRAAIIDNTFIDMLRQKVFILQQTEELSRKLEASLAKQVESPFVEEVSVPEHLIIEAIGFQGSNIRQANAIDGITSIRLNRPAGIFRICGKTLESVRRAKALLDYSVKVIPVPRTYVGPILGSGQRHIQHIVDRMGLRGLKIHDMEAYAPDFVAFELTGTSQAIRDAQMFLEFHIASLQDLDTLRGVKCQPSAPPKESPKESEVTEQEQENPAESPVTGGRSRRKSGRSSQSKPADPATVITNGDGNRPAPDADENSPGSEMKHMEDAGGYRNQMPKPDHDNVGPQKMSARNRQRRSQYMQSNNNAVTKNGEVNNHDHSSEETGTFNHVGDQVASVTGDNRQNRSSNDLKSSNRQYDRRQHNIAHTQMSNNTVPAVI
ncbi:unnamed protein product [Calicophoron daubneyi]|uniref:Fragile X mental retardation syndrome-related protein 1 n=1 Tax=Calicophoron daubneyi TaxID=300641 RepID=A0AAV2TET3_CALDB